MKNILAASAVLALFAGAASAANVKGPERPDVAPTAVMAEHSKVVTAKTLYTTKDSERLNVAATQRVNVTVFPSQGGVVERGNDNR